MVEVEVIIVALGMKVEMEEMVEEVMVKLVLQVAMVFGMGCNGQAL